MDDLTVAPPLPPAVLVVGSVNRDLVLQVDRLPGPGETVSAHGRADGLGGKGANQAVAAARAGASVALLATVGADAAGERSRAELDRLGVATHLLASAEASTGTAVVTVDGAGQNQIVVDPGANAHTSAAQVATAPVAGVAVVVVQGEVPAATMVAAVEAGRAAGATVVVNLAPFVALAPEVRAGCIVVVNEVEASQLLGTPAPSSVTAAGEAAAAVAAGSRVGVVSLGALGAVWAPSGGEAHHVPVPTPPEVVDTTGAGDALVGVLAASLAAGSAMPVAMSDAVAAGSLSVTRSGAAPSYPRFAVGAGRSAAT